MDDGNCRATLRQAAVLEAPQKVGCLVACNAHQHWGMCFFKTVRSAWWHSPNDTAYRTRSADLRSPKPAP